MNTPAASMARSLLRLSSLCRAYLPALRDGAKASGWHQNAACAESLLSEAETAYANARAAIEAAPAPHAPVNLIDLLTRALPYVESEAERLNFSGDSTEADALAHSIRNALHAASLAEGEDLSRAERETVNGAVLAALRDTSDMLENYAGQAEASGEPCVIEALATARAALARGESAHAADPLVAMLHKGQTLADLVAGAEETPEASAKALANWAMEAREAIRGRALPAAADPLLASRQMLEALREIRPFLFDGTPDADVSPWERTLREMLTSALEAGEAGRAPGVCLYLDLSTAHLPASDLRVLSTPNAYGPGCPIVRPHEYGAWVHVRHDDGEAQAEREALTREGLTPALAAILAHARRLGCYWVNLDRDAETVPGLPTFEHGTAEPGQG